MLATREGFLSVRIRYPGHRLHRCVRSPKLRTFAEVAPYLHATLAASHAQPVRPWSLLSVDDDTGRCSAIYVSSPMSKLPHVWRWRAERDKRTSPGLCCVGLAWRGFHLTSLRKSCRDLLHAIDKVDCGRGRKHHTAGRVTAAADRRVGLDFIESRHRKFDPQRLPIENDAVDCICESFRDFRPVDLADCRR